MNKCAYLLVCFKLPTAGINLLIPRYPTTDTLNVFARTLILFKKTVYISDNLL